MKPTVRNIAEKANVSTASVSLVLNDKPSRITEATRERILEAARELGYNFEEKKKKEKQIKENREEIIKSSAVIGVIRPRYYNEFLDACQKGIDQYSRVYGYHTVICAGNDTTKQTLDSIQFLKSLKVAGLIVIPPMDMNIEKNNEKLGRALKDAGIPFLLLNQAIDRVYCDFITADNKSGGYMATEYLIHNGYDKIGMIVGNREVYTCRKRIEGYKEALAFYNISIKEEYIYYGQYKRQTGYEGMKYLYDLGVKAVFAYDDEIALGVYQYAGENGLTIGKDISVVGFDDVYVSAVLTPPLTTIAQPGEQMGKKACETIINRITGKDKEAVRNTYFSPILVERNSVKMEK
ncbi:LacI family DNA-binding transcriptional regulator [Blautia sp. MSJ-19]|uniref:LacI family DNA-binding transcriptional regulator n=1 Tax=Blautia sp. MSJ-19 TaxID=2841517 RepID=UPI001C0F2409|nr:LacI family DNA-binding transcriptional regulator [Blautia sp. MSJ-19]MBU5482199.1 LacI family transcriptional regulator [Blautia sp. MSJ-19]